MGTRQWRVGGHGIPGSSGYIPPPGLQPASSGIQTSNIVAATEQLKSTNQQSGPASVTSSANLCSGQRNRSIRQGVAMSGTYANEILSILGEEPTIKRAAVYIKLIDKLSMDESNLPINFPSPQ